MQSLFRYRGKTLSLDDIRFIRDLIAENPDASRWALSKKLCIAWDWVQPNGALRDMVCRGLMLRLHEGGYIKLPAKKRNPPNPFVNRKSPEKVEIDQTPIHKSLSEILPLEIRQVRRTTHEKTANSLIEHYHYLGYCHPVGEHLKYIVFSKDRPIACMSWSSAPRHIGCRDRFIGWEPETRKKNLHLIAYNSRYLILPWVSVRYLASHLLGRIAKVLPVDWQRVYNHRLCYLETFIDTDRGFNGSCYRGANWIEVGYTTGRGKNDHTNKVNRSLKTVLGYPLSKSFREILRHG
ncbi:MAG: DUF4338 domain-containing protein [Planctomycetes bacterium]|nr:DUF4338 domain-containing protein [Planctomycetota bacterium]